MLVIIIISESLGSQEPAVVPLRFFSQRAYRGSSSASSRYVLYPLSCPHISWLWLLDRVLVDVVIVMFLGRWRVVRWMGEGAKGCGGKLSGYASQAARMKLYLLNHILTLGVTPCVTSFHKTLRCAIGFMSSATHYLYLHHHPIPRGISIIIRPYEPPHLQTSV